MKEHKLSSNVKKCGAAMQMIQAVKAFLVARRPENSACNVTKQ